MKSASKPQPLANLELIALSADDAIGIEAVGADRIELCSAIELGGLTPSLGLTRKVLSAVNIPVRVMIRCRAGDFVYSESEKRTMERDLALLLDSGAEGVVIGATTPEGEVDELWLNSLFTHFGRFKMTYSRAIDTLPDPIAAAETLVKLRVDSILTSGGQPSAEAGAEAVHELQAELGDWIKFVLAGKVRPDNATSLITKTGVGWLHAGIFKTKKGHDLGQSHLPNTWQELDLAEATRLVQALRP